MDILLNSTPNLHNCVCFTNLVTDRVEIVGQQGPTMTKKVHTSSPIDDSKESLENPFSDLGIHLASLFGVQP